MGTFDDVEVEVEPVAEFQDPQHPIFEHSAFGISLLQSQEATLGAAEIDIRGNGDFVGDAEAGETIYIDEGNGAESIMESELAVEVLVGVLGGVVLCVALVVLICVGVKRRKKGNKKQVNPITIEAGPVDN